MVIALALMMFAVSIAAMVVARRASRGKRTAHWLFSRDTGVKLQWGENTSGLVTSKDGGFVERPAAVFHMRTGRAFIERGPERWRRSRRPVYLVREGDSAPIQMNPDGTAFINNVTDDEFSTRQDLAAELAVAEGTHKAVRGDFIGRLLAIATLVLVVALAAVIVAIIAKGATE